jgi:4-hydroxythreonine-4-phosphate dehydrogenase
MSKTRIAITLGDPAGIGPEIVFRAVNSLKVQRVCSPVVFGDSLSLSKYFKSVKNCELVESSRVKGKIKTGAACAAGGKAAYYAIEKAVGFCLEKGANRPLVTAPVSKESLKLAGVNYPGHTELLADLTKSKKVAMIMVCGNIHGVMVTRHIPLSGVSSEIKPKNIVETVKLACDFFKKSGDKNIKIALCGLNPHAGDNGILGNEEKKFIYPAYDILKKSGINISKPLPADSAWLKTKNGEYGLICGMYHDQIMIPLKCIGAKKIVNVTAGLPFVRTSPGHGTAFDIAGKGKAFAEAMIEAILYAVNN